MKGKVETYNDEQCVNSTTAKRLDYSSKSKAIQKRVLNMEQKSLVHDNHDVEVFISL